jgi:hypothetical protein
VFRGLINSPNSAAHVHQPVNLERMPIPQERAVLWVLLPTCSISSTIPTSARRFLERFAVEPVPGPLDAFTDYLRKESAMWGAVIRKANGKIE